MSNAAKFEVPDSGDNGKTYVYSSGSDSHVLTSLAALYQPLDSDLTAIAALTTTVFGRALLALADAAALRTAADVGAQAVGGDLTGTVGNAQIAAGAVGATELATDAVTNAKVADDAIGIAELSATGTPSSSTFLRGDNTWATPSGGASALDDLTDVTISGASTGQVLKYNGSAWVNDTDATAGGTTALDDLSDVTITAAASGDILRHNGTAWVDTPGTTHFEAAGAVAAHEADTTSVHGIADTSALVTTSTSLGGDLTGTIGAAQIASGAIVNADINASAAIALSKLATDPLARANHTGTQLASTVSDFSEAVDDRVAALLVAGTNITLTYNDGAGTLTVAASGGGSFSFDNDQAWLAAQMWG